MPSLHLADFLRLDVAWPPTVCHHRFQRLGEFVCLLADGQDLSLALITANLARPYDGGKKLPFC